MRDLIHKILGNKNDFEKLFFTNEFKVLAGKSMQRVLWLALILLLTFVSLGFSVGGYRYLENRMDNPFTNWVNWPVGLGYEEEVTKIKSFFEIESNRNKYDLNGVSIYNITNFPFLSHKKNNTEGKYMRGRVFDPIEEMALMEDVLDDDRGNVLYGVSFSGKSEEPNPFEQNPCGIVVTSAMLDALEIEDKKSIEKILLYDVGGNGEDFSIYLDVISVVEELPNNVDFLCAVSLYNLRNSAYDKSGFIDVSTRYNNLKFVSSIKDKDFILASMKEANPKIEIIELEQKDFSIMKNKPLFNYILHISEHYKPLERQIFVANLQREIKNKKGTNVFFEKFTEYTCMKKEDVRNPHYVAFNFNRLNEIEQFDMDMQKEYGVEISMSQIESAKNFSIVSRLTQVLSVALLIFSIISIVFYVNSLLKTHLEKMKMNLGTFKAFGLSDEVLLKSYLKIIFTFINLGVIIGFLFALFFALIIYMITGVVFVDLLNSWVFLASIILLVISLGLCNMTITNILNNTPGDLIYNRI